MTEKTQSQRPVKYQVYGDFGPKPRLHPVYVALVWVVAVIVMTIGQGLGVLPGLALGVLEQGADLNTTGMLYILIVTFGAGALLALLWVRFVENRSLASLGLRKQAAVSRFGRGLLMGLAFNAAAVFAIYALGGYDIAALFPAFSSPAALMMIALLLLGFIVQGSTEEILMRGWVMSAMASRFGIIIAIAVNSTIFAALHLGNEGLDHINWIAMANIVLVGVFLSLYALRERSLLGVCGFHAAWNWLLGLGFGLEVSAMTIDSPALLVDFDNKTGAATWLTGGSFGPEGSIVVTVLLAAGSLWFLRPKKG